MKIGEQEWRRFFPFLAWTDLVTPASLRADLYAGFTNATIVLPQAVAFATIAGLPPIYGLYTAMITPIVAALTGASLIMISGPTTAISAVVFSILSEKFSPGTPEFIEAALLLSLLVGAFQLGLALAKLGRLVAFVSHSVMVGFTAAAAVLIAVSQLGDALGLELPRGGTIIERIANVVGGLSDSNVYALVVAASTLAVLLIMVRIAPRLPGFLFALVIGGLLSWFLGASEVGIKLVGALPAILPSFDPAPISLQRIANLSEGAFAIALIGLLEAISIGRAFAFKMQRPFDANQEIYGQGFSNVVGGLFQAFPGSGSFTRSGINYEAGAKTPLSAVFASLFFVLILLFVSPLVAEVPMPAIAGLILYVAFRLIDIKEIRHALSTSRSETIIIAVTFVAGLVVKLEFAIYVGVILSLLFFLLRTSRPTLAISAPDQKSTRRSFRNVDAFGLPECPQAVFTRLDGPLYFGSVEHLERSFRHIERSRPDQQFLVIVIKGIGEVDLAGADLIAHEAQRRRRRGGDLFVIARYPPLVRKLEQLGLLTTLESDHLLDSKGDAIEALMTRMRDDVCARCTTRIFAECANRPDNNRVGHQSDPAAGSTLDGG